MVGRILKCPLRFLPPEGHTLYNPFSLRVDGTCEYDDVSSVNKLNYMAKVNKLLQM